MNKWQKLGIFAGVCTAVLTTAHLINKLIFSTATSKGITDKRNNSCYPWKFGNVCYSIQGTGKPILLIHDLNSFSSSYEWDNVIDLLAKKHTVYAIDLLGCGNSDKPNLTYTTYMYTQLVSDFINNIIKEKTDVIATQSSSPLVIATAFNNKDIIDKIILVSPESIKAAMLTPTKQSKFTRIILETPIIGTLVYNICASKNSINNTMANHVFANKEVPTDYLDAYYESAHLQGAASKHLYTSKACHYTTVAIARLLASIDNCIYIIGGELDNNANVIDEYTSLNSAIEIYLIPNSKKLPQVEEPEEFTKQVEIFLG